MGIKQKIIIYIAIVLVVIGAVVYAIILPTIKDIEEINNSVLAERIDLEKKYLRGQLLKQTVENFEKIKPQENKLLEIYIGKDEELKFITLLETIAEKNLINQSIQLSAPTTGATETYEPLALSITSSGGFLELLQYLRDIEQMKYYFNISKLAISTDIRTQTEGRSITVQMNGQVFKLLKSEADDLTKEN